MARAKSSLVEVLEGYRWRDGGEVSVLGFDPGTGGRAFRERIGIVLQETGFEDEFRWQGVSMSLLPGLIAVTVVAVGFATLGAVLASLLQHRAGDPAQLR